MIPHNEIQPIHVDQLAAQFKTKTVDDELVKSVTDALPRLANEKKAKKETMNSLCRLQDAIPKHAELEGKLDQLALKAALNKSFIGPELPLMEEGTLRDIARLPGAALGVAEEHVRENPRMYVNIASALGLSYVAHKLYTMMTKTAEATKDAAEATKDAASKAGNTVKNYFLWILGGVATVVGLEYINPEFWKKTKEKVSEYFEKDKNPQAPGTVPANPPVAPPNAPQQPQGPQDFETLTPGQNIIGLPVKVEGVVVTIEKSPAAFLVDGKNGKKKWKLVGTGSKGKNAKFQFLDAHVQNDEVILKSEGSGNSRLTGWIKKEDVSRIPAQQMRDIVKHLSEESVPYTKMEPVDGETFELQAA